VVCTLRKGSYFQTCPSCGPTRLGAPRGSSGTVRNMTTSGASEGNRGSNGGYAGPPSGTCMGNGGLSPEVALRLLEGLSKVATVVSDWGEGVAGAMTRWPY
jgi:hypothetical protein